MPAMTMSNQARHFLSCRHDGPVGAVEMHLISPFPGEDPLGDRLNVVLQRAAGPVRWSAHDGSVYHPVENVWQYLRQNWLSNRVFDTYEDILDAGCEAWNRLMEDRANMGPVRHRFSGRCAVG
jgi:hypothetical protein